ILRGFLNDRFYAALQSLPLEASLKTRYAQKGARYQRELDQAAVQASRAVSLLEASAPLKDAEQLNQSTWNASRRLSRELEHYVSLPFQLLKIRRSSSWFSRLRTSTEETALRREFERVAQAP